MVTYLSTMHDMKNALSGSAGFTSICTHREL